MRIELLLIDDNGTIRSATAQRKIMLIIKLLITAVAGLE
jgi:hypothetical protein